jgi:hypothetical protein
MLRKNPDMIGKFYWSSGHLDSNGLDIGIYSV